jgi:hypothetical protein
MATKHSAEVTGLRIDDQAVVFSATVDGPEGAKGEGRMTIYDASGTQRSLTELGELTLGQRWDAWLELPAETLGDGDYAVWVEVWTTQPGSSDSSQDAKSAGFLVGRGRVYPSSEQVAKREFDMSVTMSTPRLEGSWVVFDMTNPHDHDVPVTHEVWVGNDDAQWGPLRGEELLQAGATQQAHHLLPADLANGRYRVVTSVTIEGSLVPSGLGAIEILVDGEVVTIVP